MECLLSTLKEKYSENDIAILRVEGMMDVNTVGGLEAEIRNLIKGKVFRIIINMEGLKYISSAGIGVLMGFIWQIRMNKGDIKLTNMHRDIHRVFEILELQGYFQIMENVQEALTAFGESANGNNA
jgi:anti-sigma B factor antagonist